MTSEDLLCVAGFLGSLIVTAYFLEYFFPEGLFLYLQRRRAEKFTEVFGQRFYTKVLFQYIQNGKTLLLSRAEVDLILRGIRAKLSAALRDGRSLNHIINNFLAPIDGLDDLSRHKEAVLLYCIGKSYVSFYRRPGVCFRIFKRVKVLELIDCRRAKRIHLAIGADFLPVEELTVEFPLHEELVPLGKEVIDDGDRRAANNGIHKG